MKLLFVLAVLAAPLTAQPSVSCYDVPVLQKTMCTLADGSGVMYDTTELAGSVTEYPAAAWGRMKDLVAANATAELAKRGAEAQAVQDEIKRNLDRLDLAERAGKMPKKACRAAGYVWKDGFCSLGPS